MCKSVLCAYLCCRCRSEPRSAMASRSRSPVPFTIRQQRSHSIKWSPQRHNQSPHSSQRLLHVPDKLNITSDDENNPIEASSAEQQPASAWKCELDPMLSYATRVARRDAVLCAIHPYKNAIPLQEETRRWIYNPWTQGGTRKVLARMYIVRTGCTFLQVRENDRVWFEYCYETLPPFRPAPIRIRNRKGLTKMVWFV